MGLISDYLFGSAITNLTNALEQVEATHSTSFIGAGGGFDSLPQHKQIEYSNKIPKWIGRLRSRPRHEVTLNILKNISISVRTNQRQRAATQEKLLNWLVEQGIALDADTFLASYGEEQKSHVPSTSASSREFKFSPSMPDVHNLTPIDEATLGALAIKFYEAPPSYTQTAGGTSIIRHIFAAYVFNTKHKDLERIFTIETGIVDGFHFCSFEMNGSHRNYGNCNSYTDFINFKSAVIEKTKKQISQ